MANRADLDNRAGDGMGATTPGGDAGLRSAGAQKRPGGCARPGPYFPWEERLSAERPEATRAFNARIVVRHESQHQGQIDYVAGLLRAAKESA